jgi:hypothetical protein
MRRRRGKVSEKLQSMRKESSENDNENKKRRRVYSEGKEII